MNDQVYDRFSSMNVEATEKRKRKRTIYPKLVNIEAYNTRLVEPTTAKFALESETTKFSGAPRNSEKPNYIT